MSIWLFIFGAAFIIFHKWITKNLMNLSAPWYKQEWSRRKWKLMECSTMLLGCALVLCGIGLYFIRNPVIFFIILCVWAIPTSIFNWIIK